MNVMLRDGTPVEWVPDWPQPMPGRTLVTGGKTWIIDFVEYQPEEDLIVLDVSEPIAHVDWSSPSTHGHLPLPVALFFAGAILIMVALVAWKLAS